MDNFVIEKLAFAIYRRAIKNGCHLSNEDDWQKALDAVKYFEDRDKPHDYFWELERKKVEWLYPLYLGLTEGYEEENRNDDDTGRGRS